MVQTYSNFYYSFVLYVGIKLHEADIFGNMNIQSK